MAQPRVLQTAKGTRLEAFGPAEWSLLAAAAGIWGSSFLFIAEGLEAFAPGLIAFLRIVLGAAALAMFPQARRRIERRDWPGTIALGAVWMAIPLILFPVAQQWISSSLAGMLNGSTPLFSAAIAAVLLRQAPRRIQATGLVIGFAGIVMVTLPSVAGDGASSVLGALLVLVASALYGLAVNIAVPLQQRYGALPVLLRAQLASLVMTAPLGAFGLAGSRFAWSSAVALAALGVFGTGIAFVAMATLVGRAGATRGAVAVYFIPLVAIVLGVVFRDETVTAAALAGIALVLFGAYLTSRREA